ncbi:Tyrosine-protein kinase SYK [Exaiptasia diaphana]|nr:Tyrosine-protein kinase SYK [Exaiptasia diaphana]
MLAIDHYTLHNDGLLYNLKEPCDASLFESRRRTLPRPEFQFPGRPASRSFGENDTTPRSPTVRMAPPVSPGPRSPRNPSSLPSGAGSASNFETIYDSVKLKKSSGYVNQFKSVQNQSFNLNSDSLSLGKELGHGNFGSVLKGTYQMPNGEKIPVAVKRLKSEELNNPKSEIMHEAKVMMKLDHPYIVRIIGMCTAPTMMLVMELAAEGPLNKYLKKNKQMEMLNILILMLQVAEGMQYLEAQQFVHRDLAARNVLVVNESFVKISDFGMSRAMGSGSDYYRGMNGQIIIQKLENGYRLPCPMHVPSEVYKIMKNCWEYQEEDRPSFTSIWQLLGNIIYKLKG